MSKHSQVAIVAALLAAVSMWCYVDLVLVPFQKSDAAARGLPRGNLSDLYPRWLGARELLLHGRDPYSPEVTREIQSGYYGRQLDLDRPSDPKDQQGFAYPVYVVFLLAPTIRLPFDIVQIGFRWLLLLLTAVSVPLWFRSINYRVPWTTLLIWTSFTLGCFPAVQGTKLQQLTLLVCPVIAGAFAALASGHLVLAGVLLAVATIKPQLVAIVAFWLLLWTLGDWRARRALCRSFAVTLLLLFAASNFILPGWVTRFRSAAAAYLQYTGGGKSLLDVLLGSTGGKVVSGAILLLVAVIAWRLRSARPGSFEFASTLSLVMAATLVVIPTYAPYNQLLLLPAIMLLVSRADQLRDKRRWLKAVLFIAIAAVAWPWITAAMLDVALLLYAPGTVQRAWSVPLFSSLVIPIALLGSSAVLNLKTAWCSSDVAAK